jgi:hypothetical protein
VTGLNSLVSDGRRLEIIIIIIKDLCLPTPQTGGHYTVRQIIKISQYEQKRFKLFILNCWCISE